MKNLALSSAIFALLPVFYTSVVAETVLPCTALTSMQSQISACATGRRFCNSYLGTTKRLTRTAYETTNVPGSTTTVPSSTSTKTEVTTETANATTTTVTSYITTGTTYRESCPTPPLKVRAAPPPASASCGFKKKETNQWNLHAACQCVLAPITTTTRTSSGTVTSISTLFITTTTSTTTTTPTSTASKTEATAACATPPPCSNPYTCGGSPVLCSSNCICIGRVDGNPSGECVDVAALGSCSGLQTCSTNANCPEGYFCAVKGCCNTPVCTKTSGCPNPSSRHRLFKIRSAPKMGPRNPDSGPTYLGKYDYLSTGDGA